MAKIKINEQTSTRPSEDHLQKLKEIRKDIAKEAGDKDYKGPINTVEASSSEKVIINHRPLAHALCKFICSLPISMTIKRVMGLRLLGIAPDFKPLTPGQVAIIMGIREWEVLAYESDGMEKVRSYIQKYSLQDGINKFNAESKLEKELKQTLLNPQRGQQKGE